MKSNIFLRKSYGVPHLQWKKVNDCLADKTKREKIINYTSIIKDWLSLLSVELDINNEIYESKEIIYYTYFEKKIAEQRFGIIDKIRTGIIDLLGNIVPDSYIGKNLIIEFADDEDYYKYISFFYPKNKGNKIEISPFSAGCMLNKGYMHIALNHFAKGDLSRIIAHEFTHLFLAYYNLPSWINEGIATNCETIFGNSYAFRSQVNMYNQPEMIEEHLKYWNKKKFNEFILGKTIKNYKTANLAYSLSYLMVYQMLIEHVPFELIVKKYKKNGNICTAFKSVVKKELIEYLPGSIRNKILRVNP